MVHKYALNFHHHAVTTQRFHNEDVFCIGNEASCEEFNLCSAGKQKNGRKGVVVIFFPG